jgi:hypothetical protein
LALIFGTTETRRVSKVPDTANEKTLARKMRDAWAAFAKDPNKGLEALGWPQYDPSSKYRIKTVIIQNPGTNETVEPSVIVLGDNDRNRSNATAFSFLATRTSAEVDPTIAKCSSPAKL